MSAAASDDSAATFGMDATIKDKEEESEEAVMAEHDEMVVRTKAPRHRSTFAPWHGHVGASTSGQGSQAGAGGAGGCGATMYRIYTPPRAPSKRGAVEGPGAGSHL